MIIRILYLIQELIILISNTDTVNWTRDKSKDSSFNMHIDIK